MGKSSNRITIERLIERNRLQEERGIALRQVLATQAQLSSAVKSDARVEALRRRKATDAALRELAMDVAFTVEKQQVQQKTKEDELQARIASRLEQNQQEQRIADMQRQLICLESEEIRRLKEQLSAAKVNRERAAQVLELQMRKADAAVEDARLDLAMEERRLSECEQDRRKELERRSQLSRIGRDLVSQMEESQRAKQEQKAAEYESEKQQVAAVVEKLLDEINNERRLSMERKQRYAHMFEEATRKREEEKKRSLEQKIQEENAIREYLELQRKREADLAREKELVRKEKARVLNELLQEQLKKQKEQTDYAQLIADLYEFEREEQERLKEEMQRQKREEAKTALLTAFKEQMEEREQRRQAILAEEAQFRQQLNAQFAREARLEQMTKHKQKLAIAEHNRQVKAIIQERCRQLEEAREREKEEQRKILAMEASKQAIIQQERERLLRENAELADFLPKHTLLDKRERDIINHAKQQQGSKMKLDHVTVLPRTIRSVHVKDPRLSTGDADR